MKRIILLFTLIAGITIATRAQNKPANFKFESEVHDFAKIVVNKPVTVDFKFTNNGDIPLIIKDAAAQCGCTTPILIPKAGTPIKKGEKGIVRVTFNAATMGQFIKLVTISSNAATASKILTIKGEVTAAPATKSGVSPTK